MDIAGEVDDQVAPKPDRQRSPRKPSAKRRSENSPTIGTKAARKLSGKATLSKPAKSPTIDRGKSDASLFGRIVVRTIMPQDREPARALCRALHARTFLADLPFSDSKFDRIADQVLAGQRHVVALVAELDGRVVGLIWVTAGEYFIADEGVLATVHVVAVDRDGLSPLRRAKVFLRLLKGLRVWADTRNVSKILLHVTTGCNLRSTDKLLRAAGLTYVGAAYVG